MVISAWRGGPSPAESSSVRTETAPGAAVDSAGCGVPLEGRNPPVDGRYIERPALEYTAAGWTALSGWAVVVVLATGARDAESRRATASSITGPGAGRWRYGWRLSGRGLPTASTL